MYPLLLAWFVLVPRPTMALPSTNSAPTDLVSWGDSVVANKGAWAAVTDTVLVPCKESSVTPTPCFPKKKYVRHRGAPVKRVVRKAVVKSPPAVRPKLALKPRVRKTV